MATIKNNRAALYLCTLHVLLQILLLSFNFAHINLNTVLHYILIIFSDISYILAIAYIITMLKAFNTQNPVTPFIIFLVIETLSYTVYFLPYPPLSAVKLYSTAAMSFLFLCITIYLLVVSVDITPRALALSCRIFFITMLSVFIFSVVIIPFVGFKLLYLNPDYLQFFRYIEILPACALLFTIQTIHQLLSPKEIVLE